MVLADIEHLLKSSMGLDAASIGSSAIERAVGERQRATELADPVAYWNRLRVSGAELQALVEAVVVPETWFFRDREAFVELTRFVQGEWLARHTSGVLRVLSVPCATGEEPYSIAMALLDAGVPTHRFRVEAIDISDRVLAHARHGVYRGGSFRGQALAFRDRHLEPAESGYRVRDAVRRQVTFGHGNLLAPDFLPGAASHDVIYCRNVLIYFDRDTQDKAIRVITRLLTPDGRLFVGPSEAAVFLGNGFEQVKAPGAFALRKIDASHPAAAPRKRQASSGRPRNWSAVSPTIAAPKGRERAMPSSAAEQAVPLVERSLEAARRLANEGHLVEAARCCEAHLEAHGPVAEAFCLLGLVRDASGDHAAAVSLYRKALYLDPQHHESLVHLALLMERLDNAREAALLRARANRAGREVVT